MPEKESAEPWKLPYPTSAGEVKNGATDIEELALRLTTIFKERFLTIATHATSFAAVTGELVKATGAITVTLPVAAENSIVGVLANNHAVTVKGVSAAKIFGDFVEGLEEIKLVGYQHVVLVSDGTGWFIIAGEPKREVGDTAMTARAVSTGFEASATRLALVTVSFTAEVSGTSLIALVSVGGVQIAEMRYTKATGLTEQPGNLTFPVLPGVKWEVSFAGEGTVAKLKSSYTLL